ncbi:hypothetical protein ACHQM5_021909 [Ranunculus cassubicifolius]
MGSRKIVRDLFLSRQLLSRQILNLHLQPQQVVRTRLPLVPVNRLTSFRQYSVLDEFSKKLKGEVERNPEFQKSIKDLKEKAGELKGVKEELKVRTKQTTEDLYKRVDGVWTEAEAKAKKVSANVKEKISAATEEVKETLGLGKQESSGSRVESGRSGAKSKNGDPAPGGEKSETPQSNNTSESVFAWFKSSVSSASPTVSSAFEKLKNVKVVDYAKMGYEIVKDEIYSTPSQRRRSEYEASSSSRGERSTRTDVVVVPVKQSPWSKKWEAVRDKVRSHPAMKRIRKISQPAVEKSGEVLEDLREIWETTDHPVVHKIQDLNEKFVGETGDATVFKEIRARDPYFSLPDFVAEVEEMIRPTLSAYLKGDVETLKKHCSPEVIKRCLAERRIFESQNMFHDSKLLHVTEVRNWRVKLMGNSPLIIVQFQAQQLDCVRDRHGAITMGGDDHIVTFHYEWAMQILGIDEQGEDGSLYPVWKLRDTRQIGGYRALI